MLTFLSPLFLIGISSALIPLVVHLTRSRRMKRMPFSTTRFFTDQFLHSYRMSQVKELLLLALRMALCALFATALARPLVRPPGGSVLFGKSRGVVLVLDNSASMGYQDGGATLLDRARDSARLVLDSLDQGDTAAVVLAARRADGPEVLFNEPTPELGDVRQAVDRVAVTGLGTDLSGAIAAARGVLEPSQAESHEIYVFSDLQATGWDELERDRSGEDEASLFLVAVRPAVPGNTGVTAVQYAASRPMLGVPFAIRAAIRNDSEEARSITARLFVDDQKDPVGERRCDLEPNRWQIVRFHHTFTRGGWHSGRVSIDPDALPADNFRYFGFEVQDSMRLLALNGSPSSIPRSDELFFFRTALTVSPEAESPVRVDLVNPTGFESARLGEYPLVVLANVESLSPGAVESIEQYVDRGGNLLVFLGDKINPEFYNRTLSGSTRMHGGLLPARLGERVGEAGHATGTAGNAESAFVAAVDYDHPALATFEDPKFGNLSSVSLRTFYRLEPAEGSAILMRTSPAGGVAGSPLLVERRFGQGRVMVFASTADRDWTSFPLRPSYLPWVYRITSYLAQERLAKLPFTTTGSRVPIPFSAGEGVPELSVRKPDGTTGRAVLTNNPSSPLEFTETAQPGVYTVTERGHEDRPKLFVANLDGDESLLDPLLEEDVATLFPGGRPVAYVSDPSRVVEASLEVRRGFSLWDGLLLIALAIALFEPWFANRISLRHYARTEEGVEKTPIRTGRLGRLLRRQREPAITA